MIDDKRGPRFLALFLGITLLLSASGVQATVYAWKDANGVWNLANELEDVPEAQRPSAKKFTSKFAGLPAPESLPLSPSPDPETAPSTVTMTAYERGLERGLQSATQQVTLATELARTVLTAIPPTSPARIIIQQPSPMIIRDVSPGYYAPPFYGLIGPYSPFYWGGPYWGGYAYGFRWGRFVPHSHFFPGVRGPRRGLFFPHGHFFQDGFPVGHGLVVR
jgi:hypothetical protein